MRTPWIGVALAASLGLQVSALANSTLPDYPTDRLITAKTLSAPVSRILIAANPPSRISRTSNALQTGINNFNRGYIAKAIPYFEQACQQQPANEMAFLWLARARQKQGKPIDLEKAKSAFQKVLAINPSNAEALTSLGELWSWEPLRRTEAVELLKRAHALNPANADVSKKLAQALLWQGNAIDALRYAAPIASRYQSDKKWMRDYAQMLSATGHTDEALQIYTTVLKEEADQHLDLRMEQARALLKSGKKQEAQRLYADIVQNASGTKVIQQPEFARNMAWLAFDLGLYADAFQWDQSLPPAFQRTKDIQLRMARALSRTYRMPEAVDRFQRLYEAGLLSADEKLEYAEYLQQLHLEPEALPAPNLIENLYLEALQEAPDNGEVSLRLARLYGESESGRFEDAVGMYQKALASPSLQNRNATIKEFLDYLKSDKSQPERVEALFQEMIGAEPENLQYKMAYAEYLSWQKDRHAEALRLYVALGTADPENRTLWENRIEEVLKWHQPSTSLIPVYQEVVNLYPLNKAIWLAVARAYRNDKHYAGEAVETYNSLIKRFPDDATIKREWLGLLLSQESRRSQNIRLLEKMVQEDPGDLDVLATYGKLLSYERKYGPAMDTFEQVLSQNPEHRDALVGKGYVILWSGRKLEAKGFFSQLREQYPDDVDIAIGLAQAEKLIGRYDHALKIIEEIKPLMQKAPESSTVPTPPEEFLWVNNPRNDTLLRRQAVQDFSILPYDQTDHISDEVVEDKEPSSSRPVPGVTAETSVPNNHARTDSASQTHPNTLNSEVQSLRSEIDALTEAANSLRALQRSSRSQLDRINDSLKITRDAVPDELNLQATDDKLSVSAGTSGFQASVGEDGMRQAYGIYAAMDYDTNPLLSGLGRFRNDDLSDLEKGLLNDLRPMIRGGFLFSTQDGEPTTNRFSNYGFPNQLSLSLTPQIRVRGGVQPRRYYIPRGVDPRSTWGTEYGFGATVKYWDRLTLDGDFAITHFNQSKTENVTFQTQLQYDFSDSLRAKLGFRRYPQFNSLLSVAGLKPSRGAFAGDLVGQARENGVYAELNTNPFNHNWDWNLGYEWAFIDGEHIPTNYKNQAFTSFGYTWRYAANHQLRAGYEFLYFGYSKNTTNGFFDVTDPGLRQPVVSLRPVTLAHSGYDFGGYYSPKWFILNAFRLDLRGSLWHKLLEYKLGGSIGVQDFGLGHGIDEPSRASLSSSFDANMILNLTDWLAAYGNVDFLDAGGQFNRWRFGGGLIVRPHIDALSPMFGQKPASSDISSTASPSASTSSEE